MNLQLIRQGLSNPLSIKMCSALCGYGIWLFFSQMQSITLNHTFPIYFYAQASNAKIEAPEAVTLKIQGPRIAIQKFLQRNTAVHIDLTEKHEGKHMITIHRENLLLPDTINLLDCVVVSFTINQ